VEQHVFSVKNELNLVPSVMNCVTVLHRLTVSLKMDTFIVCAIWPTFSRSCIYYFRQKPSHSDVRISLSVTHATAEW